MSKPRQRYLLGAAREGRVFIDRAGSYWLAAESLYVNPEAPKSNITMDFLPLIRRGLARPPHNSNGSHHNFARVVWFADFGQGGEGDV